MDVMQKSYFLLVVLLLCSTSKAQVPVPAGLSPGDKYQLVFNSSSVTTGTSSNINTYNNVAQAAANGAGIGSSVGVTWKAIASTASIDARNNAVVGANTPVYNMNLGKVADGFADMWDGTIDTTLNLDEFGNSNSGDAWTGSTSAGLRATGLTLGNSSGRAWCGRPTTTGSTWLSVLQPPTGFSLSVYALSSELTVPLGGDFNSDGIVDDADYAVWLAALGGSEGNISNLGNGNGTVDAGDYALWKSNYGLSLPGAATFLSVPEPSSLLLLCAAILAAISRRAFLRVRS